MNTSTSVAPVEPAIVPTRDGWALAGLKQALLAVGIGLAVLTIGVVGWLVYRFSSMPEKEVATPPSTRVEVTTVVVTPQQEVGSIQLNQQPLHPHAASSTVASTPASATSETVTGTSSVSVVPSATTEVGVPASTSAVTSSVTVGPSTETSTPTSSSTTAQSSPETSTS